MPDLLFLPTLNPYRKYAPHFADEEMEAQRGGVTCLRSPSSESVAEESEEALPALGPRCSFQEAQCLPTARIQVEAAGASPTCTHRGWVAPSPQGRVP